MDGEPQDEQDARVESLWHVLDTRKEGQLDLKALKSGLRKLNHRDRSPHQISELELTVALQPFKMRTHFLQM